MLRRKMLKRFISLLLVTIVICSLSACKDAGNNNAEEITAEEGTAEEAAIRCLQGCVTYDYDKIDQYSVLDHKTATLIYIDWLLYNNRVEYYGGKTDQLYSQVDIYGYLSETNGYDKICKNYDEYREENIKYNRQKAKERLGEYSVDFKVNSVVDMTPKEINSFVSDMKESWYAMYCNFDYVPPASLSNIIDFSHVEEYKTVYLNCTFDSEKYGHVDDEELYIEEIPVIKINNHWKVVNIDSNLSYMFFHLR